MPFHFDLSVLSFPLVWGTTCAQTDCQFDCRATGLVRKVCFGENRGEEWWEKCLKWKWVPYSVTDVGLAEQWNLVLHSDIICSGKSMTTTTECLFIIIESDTQTINNFDLLYWSQCCVSNVIIPPPPSFVHGWGGLTYVYISGLICNVHL